MSQQAINDLRAILLQFSIFLVNHYNDVIIGAMASQITSLIIVYSTVYSGADQETWKLCIDGLCAGNSPGTGEIPAQMASDAENVSIWWRHHEYQVQRLIHHKRWQPYQFHDKRDKMLSYNNDLSSDIDIFFSLVRIAYVHIIAVHLSWI